jgi:hypothetical protein
LSLNNKIIQKIIFSLSFLQLQSAITTNNFLSFNIIIYRLSEKNHLLVKRNYPFVKVKLLIMKTVFLHIFFILFLAVLGLKNCQKTIRYQRKCIIYDTNASNCTIENIKNCPVKAIKWETLCLSYICQVTTFLF